MPRPRSRAYMLNPYGNVISEEAPDQISPQSIPAPTPSVVSPRSQQTIVPMTFGPAVSVLPSPDLEHAHAPTPNCSSKSPLTRTPPKPEPAALTPRAAYVNLPGTSALRETAPYSRYKTPMSPMSSLSPLPSEEYPDATIETNTAAPSYLSSPQTEALSMAVNDPERGILPDGLFSTRTPSPLYKHEVPRQRSPSPPLGTYATPEGPLSPGGEIITETSVADTDQMDTVRAAGSTPPARTTTTPLDDISRISVAGSTTVASSEYEGAYSGLLAPGHH